MRFFKLDLSSQDQPCYVAVPPDGDVAWGEVQALLSKTGRSPAGLLGGEPPVPLRKCYSVEEARELVEKD